MLVIKRQESVRPDHAGAIHAPSIDPAIRLLGAITYRVVWSFLNGT
jgi:hypothetical protein